MAIVYFFKLTFSLLFNYLLSYYVSQRQVSVVGVLFAGHLLRSTQSNRFQSAQEMSWTTAPACSHMRKWFLTTYQENKRRECDLGKQLSGWSATASGIW